MIMVQLNPESWIPLNKIELVGWDNEHACPAVWTNAYKVPATLFAAAPGDREAKIEALIEHLAAVQRKGYEIVEAEEPTWSVPPAPTERVFVDKSEPLIEHEGGAHANTVRRRQQCPICNPER